MVITTTAAGRTWHYSHSIGRPTGEHNTSGWGRTGGLMNGVALAVGQDNNIFILSRGFGFGSYGPDNRDTYKRVGKTTIDEDHIGDFARGELTWPAGVAVASDGNVYCSDEYTHKISYFDPNATFAFPDYDPDGERLGSWGMAGTGQGQLSGPAGMVFDKQDHLYVVDSRNERVQKFTKGGRFLTTWGSPGDGEGQFHRPWGIALDEEENVYVADWGNNRVQKFSSDGTYLTSFGADQHVGGDLDHPAGVAVDGDGDVYVTDWGNRCVRVYEPGGDAIASLYGHALEPSKAPAAMCNTRCCPCSDNRCIAVSLATRTPTTLNGLPKTRLCVSSSGGKVLISRQPAPTL